MSSTILRLPDNTCVLMRRVCRQVFCALCSSLKFRLTHLDGKEGRVCISCHSTLIKSERCFFFSLSFLFFFFFFFFFYRLILKWKFASSYIFNSYIFPSGTPPRGKRRVWFADEILNKQSESAPTTPVRGPNFSPLMRRALGGPVKSPVGSPQIRRALRPHGTNINVGTSKNTTQDIFVR